MHQSFPIRGVYQSKVNKTKQRRTDPRRFNIPLWNGNGCAQTNKTRTSVFERLKTYSEGSVNEVNDIWTPSSLQEYETNDLRDQLNAR